jgi:hypothetical protein
MSVLGSIFGILTEFSSECIKSISAFDDDRRCCNFPFWDLCKTKVCLTPWSSRQFCYFIFWKFCFKCLFGDRLPWQASRGISQGKNQNSVSHQDTPRCLSATSVRFIVHWTPYDLTYAVWALFSPKRPHRLWGPPSLLFNGYRRSFPVLKRPGRDVDHSPPSSVRVKNEWR